MFETLVRDLRLTEAAPAVLATGCGSFLVWSFSLVWSCMATGRIPRRVRNFAFWLVGAWHVFAAAVLVVVFQIHHVVLAFLAGGVVAQLASLYLADGDVGGAYGQFDGEAKPADRTPTRTPARLDAA